MSDTKSIIEDLEYLKSEYISLTHLWRKEIPFSHSSLHGETICSLFSSLHETIDSFSSQIIFKENRQFESSKHDINHGTQSTQIECDSEILDNVLKSLISQKQDLLNYLINNPADIVTPRTSTEQSAMNHSQIEQLQSLVEFERETIIRISRSIYEVEKDKMTIRSISK